MNDLRLIVLDNCKDVGKEIDNYLMKFYNTNKSFIIPIEEIRFNNGEGKIVINDTIRNKDIYILSDIGNYNITYNMFGFKNHKSPDDHFQDIKRVIYAIKGESKNIHVITPLLYQSRQNKRKTRESLDCASGLQDLINLNVKTIVTFDVHDEGMQNAIPLNTLENVRPTAYILKELLKNEKINFNNLVVVSPDTGAVDRAREYADLLSCNVGMFYKRRDLSQVINGSNPIIEHKYIGADVANKDIIIVDDIVDTGSSMLESAIKLKELKANNIYLISTFSLFTKGCQEFDKAYNNKTFTKMYSTNLSYIRDEINNSKWFVKVNCSLQIAKIIECLHKQESINILLDEWKQLN